MTKPVVLIAEELSPATIEALRQHRAVYLVAIGLLILATAGVGLTAAMVAGFGWVVGISLPLAILLGSVVSSTDAAAVFAVLRGGRLNLKHKVGRTIELNGSSWDVIGVMRWVRDQLVPKYQRT